MKVTLPATRVHSSNSFVSLGRVLVVSAIAVIAAGCATNKPSRHVERPAPAVVTPEPVSHIEPKPVHRTEARMAVVPQVQFMPVKGITQKQIANNYGDYRNGGRTHKGIDIFAPSGRDLIATTSGYIERTSSKLGGNSIYLRGDNGLTYYYAHLSRYHPKAKSGDRVDGGMVIGYVGNTGNARSTPAHLHFEIRKNGVPFNPYTTLRDPDLVVTPMGSGAPVEYADYKTGTVERPTPARNSGGIARNSTSTSGAVKKLNSEKSSTKKLAAKKLTKKQQLAATKLTKKQQLAAKKAKSRQLANKSTGKKKQLAKKSATTKKKYASKRGARGHGSRG